MSFLNISHSKQALSEQRLKQIEATFYSNFDSIELYEMLVQAKAEEIAEIGALFHDLKNSSKQDYTPVIETVLLKNLTLFPNAIGMGLWFEPNVYKINLQSFGLYSHWNKEKGQAEITSIYSKSQFDYQKQDWYRAAIPQNWNLIKKRPKKFYWTSARYDPLFDAVVITLSVLMYDQNQKIIGIATIDSPFNKIVTLLKAVSVTENSFSFLINPKNQKFSSLAEDKSPKSQYLLSLLDLKQFDKYDWDENIVGATTPRKEMKMKELPVDGGNHLLFFSKTQSGMIFGIGVPKTEIYQPIEEMRWLNYRITGITIFILLVLSAVILYIVGSIMRLLDTLYTDRETGLPNRTKLLQDFKTGNHTGIILINIDSFKQINDFFGPRCGDFILKSFASRLQELVANGKDLFSNLAGLYKLPSDEFAILLKRHIDESWLRFYLRKLSEFATEQIFHFEGQEITLNVSLGAATDHCVDPDQGQDQVHEILLSSANIALQLAKERKKHALIYDDSIRVREDYEQNITWAKSLKEAIAENRIVPYFQPIVNNNTRKIEKFECLVRLIDERGRPIKPDKYLSLSKKLKLYPKITSRIIEQSFKVSKTVGVAISINLSYEDITNPDTTSFIKDKLLEYGIAKRVCFELLESESIDNYRQVYEFINDLKDMGCSIAIDDFGTGYSNFEHLLRLNVDTVKIDGSLIKNIDKDDNALIMTRGIVGFAKKLGLTTIAERVHSKQVFDTIIDIGIDYSQGFYFGQAQRDINNKLPVPKENDSVIPLKSIRNRRGNSPKTE